MFDKLSFLKHVKECLALLSGPELVFLMDFFQNVKNRVALSSEYDTFLKDLYIVLLEEVFDRYQVHYSGLADREYRNPLPDSE